jgi:hypothetical protein
LTVVLLACLASKTACLDIFSPHSSKIFANASFASSLTLGAPAFFIILPIGGYW